MATTAHTDIGILKQLGSTLQQIFYKNNKINYKAFIIASSALFVSGHVLKSFINAKKENRLLFNKLYYKTHTNSLRYINLLLRVHLPLSINSVFIISHLRYIHELDKGTNKTSLDYNDIKSGYMYGLFNFIMSAYIINRILDRFVYKSIGDDITIKIFEKYVLSSAESELVIQMHETNKILRAKLGKGVKDIKDLENIIWEYIGPINDAVDYTEFKEIIKYVQVLKGEFILEQRQFVFEKYLTQRAFDMFDYRQIINLPFWKMKHRNGITYLFGTTAQFTVYLVRLFGKMTLSQIWYIVILELGGSHDLLDQYLYSLMSREPLYLLVALPFFLLRFTRFRADRYSGALKDWIVENVKQITLKVFGSKGFTN